MTLTQQIEDILQNNPQTRNSDITLMIELWKRHYQHKVVTTQNGRQGVCFESFYSLPREDTIKRIRARFNAKFMYLPTEVEVAKARGILEDRWREFMGYPSKAETQWPTKKTSYTEKVEQTTIL